MLSAFSQCFSHPDSDLLEKSRVVRHAKCERNFHIFYQLFGFDDAVRQRMRLIETASCYRILNQGIVADEAIDDVALAASTMVEGNAGYEQVAGSF